MMKKTENLIYFCHHEANYELLQYMVIIQDSKRYPMKIEYLIQFLLQIFCEERRRADQSDYQFFEKETNMNRILRVEVKEELYQRKDLEKVLKDLNAHFTEWIVCLITLYNLEFYKTKNVFPLFCKGVSKIIEVLIDPDLHHHSSSPDRSKVSIKT